MQWGPSSTMHQGSQNSYQTVKQGLIGWIHIQLLHWLFLTSTVFRNILTCCFALLVSHWHWLAAASLEVIAVFTVLIIEKLPTLSFIKILKIFTSFPLSGLFSDSYSYFGSFLPNNRMCLRLHFVRAHSVAQDNSIKYNCVTPVMRHPRFNGI